MTFAAETFAVRSLKVSLVLALAAAMLTACSYATYPLLAVTVIDGRPVLILYTCGRGAAQASVAEGLPAPTPSTTVSPTPTPSRAVPSPTDHRPVRSDVPYWRIGADGPDAVTVIPMFTAPAGWEVERATLSALEPGARYSADAYVDNIFGINVVHFTLEMLVALEVDEVLYGPSPPETATITRADFDQKSESTCADLRDN